MEAVAVKQKRRPKPWRVPAVTLSPKARKALEEKRANFEHSSDNARVVLTCIERIKDPVERRAMLDACVATSDASDTAHLVRNGTGAMSEFAPGARLLAAGIGKPRRYHRSQCVGTAARGMVGFDSMFDGWWETYLWLTGQGVPLGGLGGKWNVDDDERFRNSLYLPSEMTNAVERACARLHSTIPEGKDGILQVLHRTTRQDMTPEELRLECEANRILRRAGFDVEAD